MGKLFDLTGPIENGLWGYHELPGLEHIVPRVEINHIASIDNNGFFASKVVLSTISGTYLEAGSHILKDGKTLDQYPLERFYLSAKILRLPTQREKSIIGRQILEKNTPPISPGEALLIDTGWGTRWNTPGYVLSCPNFDEEALLWIIEQNISLLGVDVPCIESAWSDDEEGEKGSMLGKLFAHDILLLAPLIGLERISSPRGTLICLPINLKGTSGAPCRAIFIENDDHV
ncbi:MAG: cyclase family protein [Atribacterota bacterium]